MPATPPAPRAAPLARRPLTSEELRPSRRRAPGGAASGPGTPALGRSQVAALASEAAGTGARVAAAAGRAAVHAGWEEARRGRGPGPGRPPPSRRRPGASALRAGAAPPGRAAAAAANLRLRSGSKPPPARPLRGPGPGRATAFTLLPSPSERRRRRIERAAMIPDLDTSRTTPLRLRVLLVVCVLAAALITVRLVDLHVVQAPSLSDRVRRQLVRSDRLPAQRGSIFDRAGRDLALSVQVPTIAADPRMVSDPAGAARLLSQLISVDAGVLEERLSRPGAKFTYLARQVDEATARRVEEAKVPGVFTILEPKRFLPADRLAQSVLGKVSVEGEGLSGLEYQYREVLAGTPGKLVTERDQQGREIPGGRIELDPSSRGDDLVLTIDRSLQHETERRLADQIALTSARGGIAAVMDTASGELLAVANLVVEGPPAAAGAAAAAAKAERPKIVPADKNEAVTNVYEPGSVAKLITVAGAIEDEKVAADETLSVPPQIQVGDHLYTEHEPHGTASWSITDIVANSSNVGTIMIGKELGKQRFDSYLRAFGFGSRTGLGDPGESPGILLDPARYTATSMGSFPIGQGIAVTAVQMLAAYNAVANGGTYVAPRLVRSIVGPDGKERVEPAAEPRRVISAQTAAEMSKMLGEVVRVGTGALAAVDGYKVAGKTGTARKPLVGQRGYEEGAYVSSFAGFVPAEQPRLTAMVILDQPTPIFGGLVAAPVFADIARYALREMRIPPPAGTQPVTSARDADAAAARGIGDLGDARAPATLLATGLVAAATSARPPLRPSGRPSTTTTRPPTTSSTTTPSSTTSAGTVFRRPATPGTTRR